MALPQTAEELRRFVVQRLREIEAADTPENERRLTELLAKQGAQLRRGRRKGAARYTVRLAGGSAIEGVTLAEVESFVASHGDFAQQS